MSEKLIMLTPMFAMLFNSINKTWHPLLLSESPLPGPPSEGKPLRLKSRGHHTTGFTVREEAVAEAKAMGEKIESCELYLDDDIPWDGLGMPTVITFMAKIDGKIVLT